MGNTAATHILRATVLLTAALAARGTAGGNSQPLAALKGDEFAGGGCRRLGSAPHHLGVTSHTSSVVSADALTNVLPLGERASAVAALSCPGNTAA